MTQKGVAEKGRDKGDALNLVKEKAQVTITTTWYIHICWWQRKYQVCVYWEWLDLQV